jgi:hypothetical protein
VTLSSRIFRNLRTLVRLPGHAFNLITFRAQQIMLGGTLTKLVRTSAKPVQDCVMHVGLQQHTTLHHAAAQVQQRLMLGQHHTFSCSATEACPGHSKSQCKRLQS